MIQIESDQLYKILRDFHTLTGARIELLDPQMHTLMFYPPEKISFCRMLSADPQLGRKCIECDCYNSQISAKSGRPVQYCCHMGLLEAVAPVMDNEEILAYVMFGQVLLSETCDEVRETLKKRFSGPAFQEMEAAIEEIPLMTGAELSASITVLQSLITYVLSNKLIIPGRSEFIRRLDRYITENLTQVISVDDLCRTFRIKRTRLYGLAESYLGCSIAAYVRKQRIAHACDMLTGTDLPVTSVAYACGFSDYRHFSRVFLKTMGISATKYRKNKSDLF